MANNIILPKVNVLDTVITTANILVEQNGEINRYPISNLDIDGGDISVNLDDTVENINYNYNKPTSPLQYKDGTYFYPLTTVDQILMKNGTRLEENLNSALDEARVVIILTTTNNVSLSNVVVNVYNDDTNVLIETFTYTGPYAINMPIATHFRVECAGVQNYKTPEAMDFIASGANPMIVTITYEYGKRYGFRREKAESNPSDRITYLYDAEGMVPAATNLSTNAFSAGSWGDFIEEVARPVMLKYDGTVDYELDHSNQTLKLDGTNSDVANTSYNGNAMVEFREWKWVKRYQDANYEYVIFSNVQYDDTYHAYAHTNANGVVQDVFYWGMFKGTNVSSKLRSIGTGSPMVSQTRTTEITYATANGNGYYTIYKSGWEYIADLLTLISKSDNSQAVFGRGRVDTSSASAVGTLKNKSAFWGSSNGTSDVKVFWIEGFWGNVWEGMAGLINNKGNIMVKMTPPYNTTGDGYVSTGVAPSGTSGGYINTHQMTDETGQIPKTASGSETTYLCDGMWFNNSQVDYALVCGGWDSAGLCGSRCVLLDYLVSDATAAVGSRTSYIKL